ncbi:MULTISPECIES: hypothetical protein [Methylobacterium]|uniref:hypothetical protein n=1 Tax=Methylobacterium TaxID=407 RepID=UPI000AB56997|nr:MULTISPECIES: hypothetical protein [Methylobacterium]MCI9881122.1 hypothetical protein [Methylobacterium goesingense]
MDSSLPADHPLPPLVFAVDDLDGAVAAFLENPRAYVIISSEGRTIDVAAVVRADDFASRAVASLNADASYRQMAVRTAILLARPQKG